MNKSSSEDIRLRAGLDQVAFDYMRPLSLAVVFVYLFFVLINPWSLVGSMLYWIIGLDMAVVSLAAGIHIVTRKNALPIKYANFATACLALLLVASILVSLPYIQAGVTVSQLIITFLGTSMVVVSRKWLALVLIVGSTGWGILVYMGMVPQNLMIYGMSIVTAIVIAMLVLEARLSLIKRLIEMKLKDEEAKRDLAQSLEEKEAEIVERKLAEEERDRLEAQLLQAQKMEAVGRLAGGISHDINNMLAAITGTTEAMANEVAANHPHQEDLVAILDACKRGKDLTVNLLGFAMKGKYKREQVDVNHWVTTAHAYMGRAIPEGILFEIELLEDLMLVEGDPGQLNQSLINIINNAVDAMGEEGHLVIKTENVAPLEVHGVTGLEDANGDFVKIVISDTGAGMKEGTAKMVFEPFFSTKKTGTGSGLGLSMVYGTIKNHGGAVLIRSALGQGTAVTIYLPAYKGDSLKPPPHATQQGNSTAKQTGVVLLVDDEPLVRRSGSRLLQQMGHEVLHAASGKEAIALYKEHQNRITLVLLDLIMPVMGGEETFEQLVQIDSKVRVIFISAYSKDTIRVDTLLEKGAVDFIQKPFAVGEIHKAIDCALAQ